MLRLRAGLRAADRSVGIMDVVGPVADIARVLSCFEPTNPYVSGGVGIYTLLHEHTASSASKVLSRRRPEPPVDFFAVRRFWLLNRGGATRGMRLSPPTIGPIDLPPGRLYDASSRAIDCSLPNPALRKAEGNMPGSQPFDQPGSNSTSRRWRRRTLLAIAAVAGAGTVAGCSSSEESNDSADKVKNRLDDPPKSLNRTGFPISEDVIELNYMTGRHPHNASNYNKVANWQEYQKLTNISVAWGPVAFDDREEKRNLSLSGDDYPEVFYTMGFTTRDVGKYGSQGVFIDLKPLIDDYMPNLKKLMTDNKEIRDGVTFPDGGIYGAPRISDPDFTGLRIALKPFVRRSWLDKFDMDGPTTTDDYYRYLKMVKTKQPNGKADSIAYCDDSGGLSHLRNSLMGSFGVGNRGTTQPYLDADPDDKDKLRFYRITDGYRALLEYLHRLYSEGLIAKNILSVDAAKVASAAGRGTYGSMVDYAPDNHYAGANDFVPISALRGPEGHKAYSYIGSSLVSVGDFVITDKCRHRLAAARWVDHFYSDAGIKLFFMGVEGKSYKKTKHGVEFIDKIKDPKKGLTIAEAKKPYVTYPGGGAVLIKEEYFKGIESSEQSRKAAKLLEPDAEDEIWPSFTFASDESEQLDSLSDDIQKYVDESSDKFVTGDLPLSDWKKYVDKIEQMGLENYMSIQQTAYDRYRKA